MFERGATGEMTAAEVMASLATEGYHLLDDRCLPPSAANIDHVLIGPTGVFVVDTKNWTGDLTIDGNSLRQNGRRRDRHVELVRDQAVEIATMLDDLSISRAVRPVICFVGSAPIADRVLLERVHLLTDQMLLSFVRGLPKLFDENTVKRIVVDLDRRLPPRASGESLIEPIAASPPTDELVVFVQPWRKAGRARLYVKDRDGEDAGHIDLKTGEITAEERWTGVLRHLSHHNLDDEIAPDQPAAGQQRPRPLQGLLDRLGRKHHVETPPPIVVARRWQNYGHDRIYVNRLEGDVKAELGYFDVHTGRVEALAGEAELMVRYWGEHFRAVISSRP